ncbi:MAG: alpha-L-rhamnosidase N-terminal domain-containing protein, partial [Planctomycetota bacterium]
MSITDKIFPAENSFFIQYKERNTVPGLVYKYRKSFEMQSIDEKMFLRLTGASVYAVYINEKLALRGPLTSGKYIATYECKDITEFLTEGANIIAIHLMQDFYYINRVDPPQWRGAGIIGDVSFESGQTIITTDKSWKCKIDSSHSLYKPRRNSWRGFFEDVDSRKNEAEWKSISFNDSNWPPAAESYTTFPDIEIFEKRFYPDFEFEEDTSIKLLGRGSFKWIDNPDNYFWLDDYSCLEEIEYSENISSDNLEFSADKEIAQFFRLQFDNYVLGRPCFEIEADEGLELAIVFSEHQTRPESNILSTHTRMANLTRYITRQGRQSYTFFEIHGFKELQFIIQPGSGNIKFN